MWERSLSHKKKESTIATLVLAGIAVSLIIFVFGASIVFAQSSHHTTEQQNSNNTSNLAQQDSMQPVYDANGSIVGYFIPANSTQQGSMTTGQTGSPMAGGSMGGGHEGGSTVGSSVIDLTLAATIAASIGVGGFAAYKVYEIKQKGKMKTKAT